MTAPRSQERREAGLRFLSETWTQEAPYRLHASPTPDMAHGQPTSPEVFSATLVLDVLQGGGLEARVEQGLLRFLRPQPGPDGLLTMFTNRTVPPDVDCTGLGLSVLYRNGLLEPALVHRAADRLVGNRLPDGIMEVYLDAPESRRGRRDAAVCANALYLLHQLGRGAEARASEDFVRGVLEHEHLEDFLAQAPYYTSPDVFLYFVARLVRGFPSDFEEHWTALLRRRLEERRRHVARPLGLALHLLAARWVGLPPGEEAARLAASQREDGAWPADALFKFGSQGAMRYLGSEALTTAFALGALGEGRMPITPRATT